MGVLLYHYYYLLNGTEAEAFLVGLLEQFLKDSSGGVEEPGTPKATDYFRHLLDQFTKDSAPSTLCSDTKRTSVPAPLLVAAYIHRCLVGSRIL